MKAEITSKELSEIPDIITALIPGIVLDKTHGNFFVVFVSSFAVS